MSTEGDTKKISASVAMGMLTVLVLMLTALVVGRTVLLTRAYAGWRESHEQTKRAVAAVEEWKVIANRFEFNADSAIEATKVCLKMLPDTGKPLVRQ